MPRTRTVVDTTLWQAHRALELAGADTDHLEPHTAEVPYTHAEEGAADAEREAARAAREVRHAARAQVEADVALLREHGVAHPDPVVQAAARLLAGPR